MIHNKPIEKIIFTDIETTSLYATFNDMPEHQQSMFKRKYKIYFAELDKLGLDQFDYDTRTEAFYSEKAPCYPELGKIVCISVGYISPGTGNQMQLKTNHYADHDERSLLMAFLLDWEKVFCKTEWSMCAHNGFNFDFPFIAKRIIINQLPLPLYFNYVEKKPWEIAHLIDTKKLWQWGVYDGQTSLEMLCDLFGVPTSKDDIHGSEVKDIYWIDKDIERIAVYCDKDVLGLARVYLKMNGLYDIQLNTL